MRARGQAEGSADYGYYSDDPVFEEHPQPNRVNKILGAISIIIAAAFFVNTTLAANVSLNSGAPVEFGQGVVQTTACSGATNLVITPNSTFTNVSGGGSYYFSSVTISNIPTSCYGKDFTINAYDSSSSAPLALFNTSSTNAVVYNNGGTFQAGVGSAGMSVTSGSGSFTINFTFPVALSTSVSRITVQSSDHATGALGVSWTSQVSAADNSWWGLAYGNGVFVAVGITGTGNRVMTSPDGVTWTAQASAADNSWFGVTYGNGLFVAVGFSGTGNRVMTSPDGVTWTTRNSQSDINWSGVTYGNGTFVAASNTGGTSRVITSTDGITWTLRAVGATNATNAWYSVTYGNGLFVAVSSNGTDQVMTSSDGITWTARTTPSSYWYSVTYGNGLFVAVGQSGTGNRVMTSPDGVTWTARTSAADSAWTSVAYGNGIFTAVASSGSGSRVMTSSDGINWSGRTAAASLSWNAVAYGNGKFVAVASSGTGNRVMTSIP